MAAFGVVVALGLATSGCGGVRPLYGPTASGQDMRQLMAAIDVTPIPGRVGQRVRNELIFANTGGGNPAPTRYKLNIVVRESVDKQLVRRSGEATAETFQIQAQFQLVDIASGTVVFQGNAVSRASYDRFEKTFSNVRAQYDAENRAADTVAESIKTRIAAYLATAA